LRPRSILKKPDESLDDDDDDPIPREPFVVNIPNNISRVDIDQYLRNVQDQRRRGLNYSYTTDDEDAVDEEEELIEQKSSAPQVNDSEPWNEVSSAIVLLAFSHPLSSSSSIGVHCSTKAMIAMPITTPCEHPTILDRRGRRILSSKSRFVNHGSKKLFGNAILFSKETCS
jgi:hypothetical protein